MPWDQLAVWLIGLAAMLYLARQVVNKRKSSGCGGCGTCETAPAPAVKPAKTDLVQIEMTRPQRRPNGPPRPADPSLN